MLRRGGGRGDPHTTRNRKQSENKGVGILWGEGLSRNVLQLRSGQACLQCVCVGVCVWVCGVCVCVCLGGCVLGWADFFYK